MEARQQAKGVEEELEEESRWEVESFQALEKEDEHQATTLAQLAARQGSLHWRMRLPIALLRHRL